jgi:hypothetical protein
MPQDIRDRRLLLLCFHLLEGQLHHTCQSLAYHVLDQTTCLTHQQFSNALAFIDYHRNVLTLAFVLCTLGYVFICVHLTIINVDSTAAFDWSKRLQFDWTSQKGLEKLGEIVSPAIHYAPHHFQLPDLGYILNGVDVFCIT